MVLSIVCVGMVLNTSRMDIGENKIANPESQAISFKSCDFYINDIDISGSYLYAATGDSGIGVFQITSPGVLGNPVNKTIWGKIDPEAEYHYNDYIILNSIFIFGSYAYISVTGWDTMTGSFRGVSIINVATPMSPGTEKYVEVTDDDWGPYGLYVDGNWLYVALGDLGLAIINVTDPMNPEAPIYVSLSGDARGVCVANNYAYVSCSYWGVAIIDVSNPEVPGTPIYAPGVSDSRQALVSGNYLYIADGADGLSILDITTPASAIHVGSWLIEGFATDIQKSGNYIYLTGGAAGLTVYNVQTPSNPTLNKTKNCQKDVNCLDISGNFAFVEQDLIGVGIIDISSPNTFGDDERLPEGATLKKTLTMEHSFEIDTVLGHYDDDLSYFCILTETIKIYTYGEMYDWIQIDFNIYDQSDDDIWTYWLQIKDLSGQILGSYYNIQEINFWEDDSIVIRVTKNEGYIFAFDGDLEWELCVSHTEYWDIPTQTLYITCTSWQTQHKQVDFSSKFDPQGDLMKTIIISVGVISGISAIGIVALVIKKKRSSTSWDYEPKKKKSKIDDEWNSYSSKPKPVDFSDLSKNPDDEELFKF